MDLNTATQIRLLACQQCKTIEEIPDFDGPPERDDLLQTLVSRHQSNGVPHIGGLFKVEEAKWQDARVRNDVSREIANKLSGGDTGLGTEYYDVRNTYAEDALNCWKKHQRNPACNEYKSEQMLLTPGTKAERKAAGMPEYRSNSYLCHFCPVHSLVMEAARKKAGLYNE